MIGSSPLAVEAVERVKADNDVDKVITCNRGIVIDPTPDYYFLTDGKASRLFNAHARNAQMAGTVCVTLKRCEAALRNRGLDWFDEIVREDDGYEPFKMSGIWCLEYAARHGATTIFLAGMDGYSGDLSVPDYFVSTWGHVTRQTDWTHEIIKPRCDVLAAKYPDIAWIQYGQPRYSVRAANWTVNAL